MCTSFNENHPHVIGTQAKVDTANRQQSSVVQGTRTVHSAFLLLGLLQIQKGWIFYLFDSLLERKDPLRDLLPVLFFKS